MCWEEFSEHRAVQLVLMHIIQRKSPGRQVQLNDGLLVKVQGFVNLDGKSGGINGMKELEMTHAG